jgi:hypothetical protein
MVLLVLVAIQARARFGYTMTLDALQDRIAEDEGPNPRQLLVSEVDSHLVGWPSQSRTEDAAHRSSIHLSWRGLTSSYEITLPYDHTEENPAIMGLETKDAPPEVEEVADPSTPVSPHSGMPPSTAMQGSGAPAGPGGGPGSRPEPDDGEPAEGATDESGEATATEDPVEATPAEGTEPDAGTPESGDNPTDTPTTPPSDAPDSATPAESSTEPEGETSTPDSTPEE